MEQKSLPSGVLLERLPALEIDGARATPVMLEPGTRFRVNLGKFEWLGREGLYTEISLAGNSNRRFRVRYHQFRTACGSSHDLLKKRAPNASPRA